ncbi:hypothetical protein BD309DRAFT_620083 [Dichomitus squalens]|uniref:Uncharacterized protein n=1 Tax=Dichomitus squalens TaxID=114155 RepID=A0A4Q9P1D6_9APHY|nr:hypothetical protein BD309DRAFT_620083 [Dichomitus squalens]TBU65328.1 hypothetical protein BD310DRAFT_3326 [Dichomitus squalens]
MDSASSTHSPCGPVTPSVGTVSHACLHARLAPCPDASRCVKPRIPFSRFICALSRGYGRNRGPWTLDGSAAFPSQLQLSTDTGIPRRARFTVALFRSQACLPEVLAQHARVCNYGRAILSPVPGSKRARAIYTGEGPVYDRLWRGTLLPYSMHPNIHTDSYSMEHANFAT